MIFDQFPIPLEFYWIVIPFIVVGVLIWLFRFWNGEVEGND